MYRSKLCWDTGVERIDRILYDETSHVTGINKDLRLGTSLGSDCQAKVRSLIVKYWDYFTTEGDKRLILGYKFGVDTSGARPVCYKKPSYGPYESKIIMSQLEDLLGLKWVKECGEPWGA